MLAVENADFRFLCRHLPFKGFSLEKVGNWTGLLPDGIIESAVQLRGSVNAVGLRGAKGLLRPSLRFLCLWTCLRLSVKR